MRILGSAGLLVLMVIGGCSSVSDEPHIGVWDRPGGQEMIFEKGGRLITRSVGDNAIFREHQYTIDYEADPIEVEMVATSTSKIIVSFPNENEMRVTKPGSNLNGQPDKDYVGFVRSSNADRISAEIDAQLERQ